MYKLFSQTIFVDRNERDSLYAVIYNKDVALQIVKHLNENPSSTDFFWLEDEDGNTVDGERKYCRCILCDRVRSKEELDTHGACELGCYVD